MVAVHLITISKTFISWLSIFATSFSLCFLSFKRRSARSYYALHYSPLATTFWFTSTPFSLAIYVASPVRQACRTLLPTDVNIRYQKHSNKSLAAVSTFFWYFFSLSLDTFRSNIARSLVVTWADSRGGIVADLPDSFFENIEPMLETDGLDGILECSVKA